MFDGIPMQMCQFHQIQIINRYLTKKPKVLASIELRNLALTLTKTKKETFYLAMNQWYNKWEKYLKERSVNAQTGKSTYMHKRLKSAWLSLNRNLPLLFVYQEHKELMMHNTTNALDGLFADLKNKLRCHNGLSIQQKKSL
jgi:putative cell wall-binding protein